MQYLLLAVSFVLLLAGALGFTNAVEWAGHKLNLGAGAVGSILAAVATALPESTIPMVAVITGEQSGGIAVGAIIGAPFLLGTLAMALVGAAAYGFRGRRRQGVQLEVHRGSTVRDLLVFAVFLTAALGLGVFGVRALNVAGAVVLVIAYLAYVWRTVRAGGESETEASLKPLYFDLSKQDRPTGWQVTAQLVLSLAAIIGGAQLFVTVIEHLATDLGVPALVLALVLAPLATELPEKANSFIWVRTGKDPLALGNITGAMVFQSMIPVAVGMAFTPWRLDGYALGAGGCALVGGLIALAAIHRAERFRLPAIVAWVLLYGGFVVAVIVTS